MKEEQAIPSPKADAERRPYDGEDPWSCWVTNQQTCRLRGWCSPKGPNAYKASAARGETKCAAKGAQ
eukprot:3141787-Amphidinium_carterae.1